ncbi:MAG: WhiB family transcriptional regulator [Ornithinimicrobium sp.]
MIATDEASTAWSHFTGRLDELAREGRSTPCRVDPEPFTSDDQDDRAEAAYACAGCPALIACGTYAETAREAHHVWGGIDRTGLDRRKSEEVAA